MTTDREKAISWWNSLLKDEQEDKVQILEGIKMFGDGEYRSTETLTGREIEIIWRHYNS